MVTSGKPSLVYLKLELAGLTSVFAQTKAERAREQAQRLRRKAQPDNKKKKICASSSMWIPLPGADQAAIHSFLFSILQNVKPVLKHHD